MQNRKSTHVSGEIMFAIVSVAFLAGSLFGSATYVISSNFFGVYTAVAISIGSLVGYSIFCVTLIAIVAVRAYALSLAASQSMEEKHACRCGNYPNRPDRGGGVLHGSPDPSVRPDPGA